MTKKVRVKSNNQSGGITTGIVNISSSNNNKKKYSIIVVVMLILAVLTFFGLTGDKMFGKDKTPSEIYNVESNNQSGGITAGKIDNLNILTDKESLGIREPDGLYQGGKKVGTVFNFQTNEEEGTFTISSIEYDKPLRDISVVYQPYEFQEYVIQIKSVHDLVAISPPGAEGVSGIILSKS